MTSEALVTMELERGVVGNLATLGELRDAAEQRDVPDACGRLVRAARAAGVPVIHCVAAWRADRRGTPLNTPLARNLGHNPSQILEDTDAVGLIDELGDTSDDLSSVRHHGMGPFFGTDLDPLLRSLDIRTVVVCGVSLNIGVPALVLGAVDRGYEVTLATDAVVGVPPGYGDQVVAHTMASLARLRTVEAITSGWGSG